jgi:FkbM family methyltransferase
MRTRSRSVAPFNRAVLGLGAPPLAVAQRRAGHRLILDLRSGTEWFPYYTGEFDDGDARAARELLRRRPGAAVDAGANVGLWTVPLAAEASALGTRVIAAEPLPQNTRRRLLDNLRLNGLEGCVDIRQVALSDGPGWLTMTFREDFAGGAGTGNAAVLFDDGTDGQWDGVELAVRSLDDVLDDVGRPPVSIIKADVGGHEDRLLVGAIRTLARDRPTVFAEWNSVYYARRNVDPTDATTPLLRQLDYRCLRRGPTGWITDARFRSDLPFENVLLVPEERADELVDPVRRTVRSIR